MKKGRKMEAFEDDEVLDAGDFSTSEDRRRTLLFKAAPRSRRVQLLAQGAKDIRCGSCFRIRPLIGAVECGDGWLCEDCVSACDILVR